MSVPLWNGCYNKIKIDIGQVGNMTARVTRSNGEQSRRKILDAARDIAGERGYSGTSISEVSKQSGLPNSSIYWHFADKDALFAAVIEDSYEQWKEDFNQRARTRMASPGEALVHLHESLGSFPAFLRFGHLVILEQHDTELSARRAFIQIRKKALEDLATMFTRSTDCDRATANKLAAMALALVDGAFLAGVAGEKTLTRNKELGEMFDACISFAVQKKKQR